jgi:hypothetical protein
LKVVREKKQIIYKGKPTKITADFPMETLKAKRHGVRSSGHSMNENNFSPGIFYPAKLLFKIDGAIKIFHDKQKLK